MLVDEGLLDLDEVPVGQIVALAHGIEEGAAKENRVLVGSLVVDSE